jgi:AraC-like DNA-binding protein
MLLGSATDAKVLGPMTTTEIHYRLLTGPCGGMLRRLIRSDSPPSLVARATALLRRDYREPLVMAELAAAVGMSVSSFHRHFKAVTSLSPLQYQKELRLMEARKKLSAGAELVSTIAFDVGYQSLSQFSREYARKFGHPPSLTTASETPLNRRIQSQHFLR